jgi:hypothetical protein
VDIRRRLAAAVGVCVPPAASTTPLTPQMPPTGPVRVILRRHVQEPFTSYGLCTVLGAMCYEPLLPARG